MVAGMTEDYLQRFGGMGRLYGREGMARLAAAHVAVIGVGGVGSWTVEALARSGVGRLTLIDMDDVCITNTNRQLPALANTLGHPKVAVLRERAHLIHPGCDIRAVAEFLTAANAGRLLSAGFDFVVDAVDRAIVKALIIACCRDAGIPVLTVGGAGGRRDATAVRCGDLARTGGDDLLRLVRRELRRMHGFPGGDTSAEFGVPAIYSAEPQVYPWADGTCRSGAEPGGSLKMDCASGFGAASFVTGVFGLAAAGEVVRRLTRCGP
jgi:tRNA A37 threonylcarbamoyladenosine dehydratase